MAPRASLLAALLLAGLCACRNDSPGAPPDAPVAPSMAPSTAPRVHDIQGVGHRSPLAGQAVRDVFGLVTSPGRRGFWMQDEPARADDRAATSEALFVHGVTRALSADGADIELQPGDAVLVSGTVTEWRPAGDDDSLALTEIDAVSALRLLDRGRPLPAPVIIGRDGRDGRGGRQPPPARPAAPGEPDESPGSDVESRAELLPEYSALDFWESLEGMLVRLDDVVAVSPSDARGELWVVAGAAARNARGGLTLLPDDSHGERILLDGSRARLPRLDVGASFERPLTGVVDYAFENYRLVVQPDPAGPPRASGGAQPEVAEPPPPGALSVASFNLENLSATAPQRRFDALARQIVVALRAPDLLGLQEVQDDSGPRDDGTVTAQRTLERLVDAIVAGGGPRYACLVLDPVDGQDGGQPGGNVRVALLLDPARLVAEGTPRRLAPDDPAFAHSRKPLLATLRWQGRPLVVIVNHWKSKSGDEPLAGRHQPPRRATEVQRAAQARAVHAAVAERLAAEPDAALIVLGDFNDFGWSEPLAVLRGDLLVDLADSLPPAERYSFVYAGNSQQLDHILVSRALQRDCAGFGFVHVNAEFADQASDHDPCLARFRPPAR